MQPMQVRGGGGGEGRIRRTSRRRRRTRRGRWNGEEEREEEKVLQCEWTTFSHIIGMTVVQEWIITLRGGHENIFMFLWLPYRKCCKNYISSPCVLLGFLNLGTIDLLGQTILCCGGCSVHCRIFCSIPGSTLLMPEALPIPICDYQNISRYCPWGIKSSMVKNHSTRAIIQHGNLNLLLTAESNYALVSIISESFPLSCCLDITIHRKDGQDFTSTNE